LRLFLDISRLVFGAWRTVPTGIDRVEIAYVRHWLANDPDRVTFLLRGPIGAPVAVPTSLVEDLVEAVEARRLGQAGCDDAGKSAARLARSAIMRLSLGRGLSQVSRILNQPGPRVYLLVSHLWADRPGPIAALKRRGVKFVPLVHDLIPASHPEYASPSGAKRHLLRVNSFAGLADGIIANSSATAQALLPHLSQGADEPRVITAPLGIDTPLPDPHYPVPAGPYFVCIGTIEPRKNHLLLLNLWRDLAQRLGADTPKLLLIGRRGWENENILDMLDRCPALVGKVREYSKLPDNVVAKLLQGARALLFPSFIEGYGLPLAEALALGVPAICSDLPALREVGGDVPEFLDPLDGLGWRRLILDFAQDDSRVREAQCRRLAGWSRPNWGDHFALVEPWLRQLAFAGGPLAERRYASGPDAASPEILAAPSAIGT
jgi:glycosyltransferase involved in cell wall biosynthesis